MKLTSREKTILLYGVILTCIAGAFLVPILQGTPSFILDIASAFGIAYSDSFYIGIAKLSPISANHYILYLSASIAMGCVMGKTLVSLFILFYDPEETGQSDKLDSIAPYFESIRLRKMWWGWILGITIGFWIALSNDNSKSIAIQTFNSDCRIIAPYIDEQQEEELLSEWSQMKNESDFINLYKKIRSIALKNQQTLSKNHFLEKQIPIN